MYVQYVDDPKVTFLTVYSFVYECTDGRRYIGVAHSLYN